MELISQREYARRRGIAPSLVNKYVKQGKIKLKNGKINPDQAGKALEQGGDAGTDYWKEKARHEKWKADLAEIEVAKKKHELVPVELVTEHLEKMLTAVRQKIMSLPTKSAPLIFSEESVAGMRAVLEREVDENLNELSSYNPEKPNGGLKVSVPGDKKRSRKAKAVPKVKRKRG